MTRQAAGFTLLEILVALVVLGFVMAGLSQGVQFGLRAWSTQGRLIGEHSELDAVDRTLRRIIAETDPGDSHDGTGFEGGADTLLLTSELPQAASGVVRQADMRLLVEPGGRLVLRWTPHLHAKRFGPAPRPATAELLRGVDHIELAYWGQARPGWVATWAERELPALVRIRVLFAKGDRRHWPDIVAPPMREPTS